MEWRAKYKPWLMTQSALKENEKGWIYTRGYSLSYGPDSNEKKGHSVLWFS